MRSFAEVQLITVECAFPGQMFLVTQPNNPYHLQIRSRDVIWVKENLINLAVLKCVPKHAQYVIWADADILFLDRRWISYTINQLQTNNVVQLFEVCDFLGSGNKDVLRTDHSLGYSYVNKKPIHQSTYAEWYPHPGYVWGMKYVDFIAMNGLFEGSLVGSADLHFAYAILPSPDDPCGRVEETIPASMHESYKQHVVEWATNVQRVIQGKIGYIPVRIQHLWHGDRENRQYVKRWDILANHSWNPVKYLQPNEIGLLQFNPLYQEKLQAVQVDIAKYFKSRHEDASDVIIVTKGAKTTSYRPISIRNYYHSSVAVWQPETIHSENQYSEYEEHKHMVENNLDCIDYRQKHHHCYPEY